MRSITNLAWPTEPFGAGQRPFGRDRPQLAAIDIEWSGYVRRPAWACAVYLTVDSTRALVLDGAQPSFGFEALIPGPSDEPSALVDRVDDLLVTCRRRAVTLAGHDMAPNLRRLTGYVDGRRLPGVVGVGERWTDRADKGRGMARMIDTAHDVDLPAPVALAAACGHMSLRATAIGDPAASTPAVVARQAITRTLAIGLIAARITGRYDWSTAIDLDQAVTDAAWDFLAAAGEAGLPMSAPTPCPDPYPSGDSAG